MLPWNIFFHLIELICIVVKNGDVGLVIDDDKVILTYLIYHILLTVSGSVILDQT